MSSDPPESSPFGTLQPISARLVGFADQGFAIVLRTQGYLKKRRGGASFCWKVNHQPRILLVHMWRCADATTDFTTLDLRSLRSRYLQVSATWQQSRAVCSWPASQCVQRSTMWRVSLGGLVRGLMARVISSRPSSLKECWPPRNTDCECRVSWSLCMCPARHMGKLHIKVPAASACRK